MEEKIKTLETLVEANSHVSVEWIMKNILGIDPVLFNRKLKIEKILNGRRS